MATKSTFTPMNINSLSTLLRGWELRTIGQDPEKSNGILLHLSRKDGSFVTVSVEFDIKENREYCIEAALSIN